MGMYTEIYVNVDLREDTPQTVIKTLMAVVNGDRESEYLKGKPYRWGCLFCNMSYYTPNTKCASLTFDTITNSYSLIGKGDIKNYEGEIEQFFEYIKPYCDNSFIGYHRYEEDREPILVYSDN